MRIKSKRNFISGIICVILAMLALVFYILTKENRLIVSFVLLVAMTIFNFTLSFSKGGMVERLRELSDERDHHLTMKSSYLLVCFMNYVLVGFIFMAALAYGIWKSFHFLVIMYTLGTVLTFMFISYLVINIYIDKHE